MSFFWIRSGNLGQLVANRATFPPFTPIFVEFLGLSHCAFIDETRHKMRLMRFSYKRRRSPPEVIPVVLYTPAVPGAGARVILCGLRWMETSNGADGRTEVAGCDRYHRNRNYIRNPAFSIQRERLLKIWWRCLMRWQQLRLELMNKWFIGKFFGNGAPDFIWILYE